jgi:hypothetical protein
VTLERRQADRRRYRGVTHPMGCTFVRLGPQARPLQEGP